MDSQAMQSVDLNYDDNFQTQTQGMRPPQALKMGSLNIRILMEPLGFLRLLEFLFAICAFATTVDFSTYLKFALTCDGKVEPTTSLLIEYPFSLYQINVTTCGREQFLHGNFASDAQFFVATGVLAFLYCIAIVGVYILAQNMYENVNMLPLADFIFTVVFAVFWLSGSSAWANGLNGLKTACNLKTMGLCDGIGCTFADSPEPLWGLFTKLTISVLLGFLNFVLWAGNLWFIYKETTWFQPPPVEQGGIKNTV